MGVTFPNESPEYRAARDKLMQREVSLRREMEAVAAEIRALPPGGAVPEDYEFDHIDAKGVPAKVRLSELFRPGTDTLIIYHYMFPRHRSDRRRGPSGGPIAQLPLEEGPCPSCTALLDNWEGAIPHVEGLGANIAAVEGTDQAGCGLRSTSRMAQFEAAFSCQQQLQTRLSWRGWRGTAGADPHRVPQGP
jgi:predicted dithiol-disulfide oxidoreductase (DUF899 family)